MARCRRSHWGRKFAFALAGTAGFVVDAAVLHVLARELHLEVHLARVVSFLVSMTATWQINRRLAFHDRDPEVGLWCEWRRYLGSSLLGGATNYSAFSVALAFGAFFRAHLVLAVALGSIVGMVTNWLLYSRYVFREARGRMRP